MRLIALLSWYDESPSWLASCVAGIGRFCDYVVAVDGAYALFPGARPRSHPQQAEAVVHTAEAMDLGLLLHQPKDIWRGNELEKRNYMLRLAGTIAEEGDWIMVVDADYHVLKCDPPVIRHELGTTEYEVATYTLLDGKDFLGTEGLERYANGVDISTEWTIRTRDIYRWNPTLEIGPAHWCYSAEIDGERQWLRGPYTSILDCLDLNANLVFYHRTQDRALQRREAAGGYYKAREEHRIEWLEEYV